jgi:hypothetical protein
VDKFVLILLAVVGLYFLYQGVYAFRYQHAHRRNWLSEKLLRRTPPPNGGGNAPGTGRAAIGLRSGAAGFGPLLVAGGWMTKLYRFKKQERKEKDDSSNSIDAIRLLTGAEATMISAGGVYGAEGAIWLVVNGGKEQVENAAALVKSVADEPLCEA